MAKKVIKIGYNLYRFAKPYCVPSSLALPMEQGTLDRQNRNSSVFAALKRNIFSFKMNGRGGVLVMFRNL